MEPKPAESDTTGRTAAVVVCFNPPPGLNERLCAIADQVERVIVWDNGSSVPVQCALKDEKFELLRSEDNIGIAAALNRGLARALAWGADQALLFDHDSQPAKDMLEQLLHAQQQATGAPLAVCVPRIRYALPDIRCRWPQTRQRWGLFRLRYADQMPQAEVVDLAISSGMLLDLPIWQRLGGFDEALFIDLVDTEYCLHARRQGYRILACPQAELQHSLGDVARASVAGLTVYPTHHSAMRHFYINRNRWVLMRRYALRFPAWLAYELLGAAKLMIKALLFEPQRAQKLRAMLRGNAHGMARFLRNPAAVRHGS